MLTIEAVKIQLTTLYKEIVKEFSELKPKVL